jgi:hypothetical protein
VFDDLPTAFMADLVLGGRRYESDHSLCGYYVRQNCCGVRSRVGRDLGPDLARMFVSPEPKGTSGRPVRTVGSRRRASTCDGRPAGARPCLAEGRLSLGGTPHKRGCLAHPQCSAGPGAVR